MKTQNNFHLSVAVGGAAAAGASMLAAAAKLWFAPAEIALEHLTALTAGGGALALATAGYLFRHCRGLTRFQREYAEYIRHKDFLESRCESLSQKLEELAAQHCIDSAAMSTKNINEFMDVVARLAHDNAGAREFTFYLGLDKQLGPKAYYHLDNNIEFCLTFTPRGSQHIARDLWELGAVQAGRLFARGMGIRGTQGQVIIEGELLYDTTAVGKMRLSLPLIPDKNFSREELRKIVTFELSRVNLRGRLVQEAFDTGSRFCENAIEGVVSITTAVCDSSQQRLGVISAKFVDSSTPGAVDREKVLASAARHFARAAVNENLHQMAICDGLTGLFNKRYLLDELADLVANAGRLRGALSLIIIDIDHFKKVNDRHGHQTGDMVLKGVAGLLQESVRACDLACRYGGEELVVILPDCPLDGAVTLAERIRCKIECIPFISEAGKKLKVTASFGVAELGADIKDASDLIAAADRALYEAKGNGRNQVRWAKIRQSA